MWSGEQLTRRSGMKSLTDGRVKGPENNESKYILETEGRKECLAPWEYSLPATNNFRRKPEKMMTRGAGTWDKVT